MKSNFKRFVFFSSLAISISFFTVSCDDDPTEFGLDLLPSSDRVPVGYIDTVELTLAPYTSPFYYASLNNPFVGVATDPVFGRIFAAFASDIYFPYPYDTITWGKRKILDSVKISLHFDSVMYHNPNPANPLDHSFKLAFFPLSRPIVKDSNYSASISPSFFLEGSPVLAAKLFEYPAYNTVSFYFSSSTLSYFQKYMDMDSAQIRSDTLRHEKGIYGLMFYPQYAGNDIIYRLRTGDTLTYIEFTYHTENDTTRYKIRGYFYSFYRDENVSFGYHNGGLSMISYDYSKAKVKTRLNGWSEDTLIYILGESALRAKIDFSRLNSLIKQGFYVVKADLYVAYDDYFYKTPVNPTHTLRLNDIDLKIAVTADSFASYTNVFASPLYNSKIDTATRSYQLDVTDYIYKRLNNATNIEELYFFPSYRYSFQSAFLKNKLKLRIKYIKR